MPDTKQPQVYYGPDGKISMQNRQGEYVWIPPEEYHGAVGAGYVAETPEGWVGRQLQKRHGDREITAGLMGAASGATFGIAPWIAQQVAPDTNWEAIQQYNPTSYAIGEGVGTVGSMFVPGFGAGKALAGIGKLGARGAQLAARGGGAVEAALGGGMLAKAAGGATALAGKGVAYGTAGALENAVMSSMQEVGRAGWEYHGDRPMDAYDLAKRVATAAGDSQPVVGAGLGILSPVAAAMVKPIAKGMSNIRLMTNTKAAKLAAERAVEEIGIDPVILSQYEDLLKQRTIATQSVSRLKKAGKPITGEAQKLADINARLKDMRANAPGMAERTELLKSAKAATEDYLRARVTLGRDLMARSGTISAIAKSTAAALGAAGAAMSGGSILWAGGTAAAAWQGVKRYVKQETLEKIAQKMSTSTKGLSAQTIRQEESISRGLRANVAKVRGRWNEASGRPMPAGLQKQLAGEGFADALSFVDSKLLDNPVMRHLPFAAKEAAKATKASAIYAMTMQDAEEMALAVHDVDDEAMDQIRTSAIASGMSPGQVDAVLADTFGGIQRLRETSPAQPGSVDPFTGRASISHTQAVEWKDRVATQVDPQSAMEDIADGRYTDAQIDQLKHGHPAAWSILMDIAKDLDDELKTKGIRPNRQQERFLKDVLSVGKSDENTYLLQQNYRIAQEAKASKRGSGGGLNISQPSLTHLQQVQGR